MRRWPHVKGRLERPSVIDRLEHVPLMNFQPVLNSFSSQAKKEALAKAGGESFRATMCTSVMKEPSTTSLEP